MAASTTSDLSPGDISPELVPVVEPGALALAFSQPADAGLSSELALGDLLSDALFGEVIDISDLIPRLMPQPGDPAIQPVTDPVAAHEFAAVDTADLSVTTGHAAAPLTILYDDDMLEGGSY